MGSGAVQTYCQRQQQALAQARPQGCLVRHRPRTTLYTPQETARPRALQPAARSAPDPPRELPRLDSALSVSPFLQFWPRKFLLARYSSVE